MLVKFLTSRSGVRYNIAPGDIIEMEDAEAQKFIDAGECVPASDTEIVDLIAPVSDPEATVKKKPNRKKKKSEPALDTEVQSVGPYAADPPTDI